MLMCITSFKHGQNDYSFELSFYDFKENTILCILLNLLSNFLLNYRLWLSVGIHFWRNISCSENSLVPPRQQAVIWTNVDTFLWWNMEYLGYNDVRVPVLVTNRATTMWVILASLTYKTVQGYIKSLRLRQNGRQFLDNIFKCIFLNENILILIKISLKFMLKRPINNIPALVQIMAWHWPGDKPLSVPMMVSLLTHICVTWPQWVKL